MSIHCESKFLEQIRILFNIYKRIRFFKKMYPFSSIVKDIFFFPFDYNFRLRPIRRVRNVTLAITHRCNLRCQMCYFHKELRNPCDLQLRFFKQIIDGVKLSRPCIILSGGEPFLHPDLINMVNYAKTSKLAVQIFTNGTLAEPAIVDAIVGIGLDYINFTLLGDKKSHSIITKNADSYEKFIKNLAYFASHRGSTKIILTYTVTPQTFKDIYHAVEMVKFYRLDGLRIQHYNFLLPNEFEAQNRVMERLFEGSSDTTHEVENSEDLSQMAVELTGFRKRLLKMMPNIPVQWAPFLTSAEIKDWYSNKEFKTQRDCFYPWRGILVDANGKIYPCSKIYLELGDLQSDDIFSIWNCDRMERFRRHLKKNLFPACSRCCKL